MMGTQHIDVLRSLGLVSRPNRRHVLVPLTWKALLKHRKGKDIAVLLTLLGAGSMGAIIAMRYAAGTPVTLTFPWSASGSKNVSTDEKTKTTTELTVAGLQNMGNNCFLNVVLQALASSEILVSFMEDCARVIDTQGLQAERATMPLAAAVTDLLKELAQGQSTRRILSPRRVMLALNLYARQFDLSMQQDAAEALAHLAAGLQEERDDYLHLHRPISQSFGTVLDKDAPSPQLHKSWLHWPLEGTLGSLMACQRCGFQFSTQFQYFNDVPLPLLRQADGKMIDNCTLEDCLDQFTAPEWVASVKCSHCAHMEASRLLRSRMDRSKLTASQEQLNMHALEGECRCEWARDSPQELCRLGLIKVIEKCGFDDDCACEYLTLTQGGVWDSVLTNASKRLRIGRSPEVLCLQVQRAVMNEAGELRKLTGHVRFPIILNLFPYTVAAQEGEFRNMDTRTETHSDSLIQMLRQRGVILSHIRKFQGAGYPGSLFSQELGIKGGSGLSKDKDSVEITTETSNETGLAVDARAEIASKEVSVDEDSFTDQALSTGDASRSEVEMPSFSISDCTDLGALPDPHGSSISSPQVVTGSHGWACDQDTEDKLSKSRNLLYKLLSVVVHHGGPQSGHYTVYRKVRLPKDSTLRPGYDWKDAALEGSNPEDGAGLGCREIRETSKQFESDMAFKVPKESQALRSGDVKKAVESEAEMEEYKAGGREPVVWFKVSDASVTRVEEPEVQRANASLLFYERSRSDL